MLREAFLSFDHASGHLARTYRQLQDRIVALDVELKTVNRTLEEKLQENERLRTHLEMILESLEVGVLVADEQGRITTVNRIAEEMLGVGRDELFHHTLAEIWAHVGWPSPPCTDIRHGERILTCCDSVLSNQQHKACGTVRMLQDVTLVTQLKDQVARQDRLAAMGEMVGRIAHEIRNPLGSIELFASSLNAVDQDAEERRSLIRHISTSVRALNQLLSNVLVVTGPARPRPQKVEVAEILNEVLTLAAQAIRERSVSIHVEVREGAERLMADGILMRQVLLNILLNAISASPQGGRVHLTGLVRKSTMGPGGGTPPLSQGHNQRVVVLAVQDFGEGIATEDLSRIFDPFFSRREGGTGLGLAIVHQVMKAHAGWVEVESSQGRGTNMMLCFPQEGST